jgi:predicted Zn-dependent protease
MRPEVDLIPLDDIEMEIMEELRRQIKEKGCIVRLYARTFSPKTAANMYRKQYQVDIISDALSKLSGKVIAITDKDIYSNRLNYAFWSVKDGGPAVISTHRLRPEFYQEKPDPAKVMDRLVKETIYCIGRMNGIKDCPNSRCVMFKATSARDIDFKLSEFCKDCKINNIVDSLRI